jgi:hypothetical protein
MMAGALWCLLLVRRWNRQNPAAGKEAVRCVFPPPSGPRISSEAHKPRFVVNFRRTILTGGIF